MSHYKVRHRQNTDEGHLEPALLGCCKPSNEAWWFLSLVISGLKKGKSLDVLLKQIRKKDIPGGEGKVREVREKILNQFNGLVEANMNRLREAEEIGKKRIRVSENERKKPKETSIVNVMDL